jgi:sec-independent protein translocase protein TatA
MPFRLGDWLVVLILFLLFFGPNKLPDMAKAIGNALNEFKKAANPTPENQNSPQNQNQPAQPVLAAASATPTKRRKSPVRKGRSKSSR